MSTSGKVIKCRAAVLWKKDDPLVVEEIEVEPPKAGEVRVHVVSASLCRSDLVAVGGKVIPGLYHGQYPIVIGHEAVGIVESVGSGVRNFKPGDQVIPLYMAECGECVSCRSGTSNICADAAAAMKEADGLMLDGTTRMSCRGKKVFHFAGCSTLSEYLVTREARLAKIGPVPTDSLWKLCVMGCCVPTGMGAALNTGKVKPGAVCAVWGTGAVGLAAVLGCKKAGATTIIGIDTNKEKESIAKKFGCSDFLNPTSIKETVPEYLTKKYGGCDNTFEVVGNTKVMKDAFESTRPGGTCVILGAAEPGLQMSIDPMHLLFKRTLTGSMFGEYRGRSDLPKLVEEVSRKTLDPGMFITQTVKIDKVNQAMHDFLAGKAIRIAMVF